MRQTVCTCFCQKSKGIAKSWSKGFSPSSKSSCHQTKIQSQSWCFGFWGPTACNYAMATVSRCCKKHGKTPLKYSCTRLAMCWDLEPPFCPKARRYLDWVNRTLRKTYRLKPTLTSAKLNSSRLTPQKCRSTKFWQALSARLQAQCSTSHLKRRLPLSTAQPPTAGFWRSIRKTTWLRKR